MSTVQKSINLDVPVHTAYNQWTQFEQFPQFMEGVDNVKQTAPDKTHWTISIGGITREFDAEITERHPDHRIAWRATDGSANAGVVTFHRIGDDQSRVSLQLDTEPEGAVEKIGDALGLIERRAARDLERFKDLIEHQDGASGGWRGEITNADDDRTTPEFAGGGPPGHAPAAGPQATPLAGRDAVGQPFGSPRLE